MSADKRRVVLLALLLSTSLLAQTPIPAKAAVSYRIWTEPAAPIVGQATTIYVATVWPASHPPDANSQPMAMAEFPWDFVVDSPGGTRTKIELTHDRVEGNLWSGTFTFSEPGKWVVGLDPRHLGTPVDSTLGARVELDIASSGLGVADPAPGLAIAALALAVAGVAIFLTKRRANR